MKTWQAPRVPDIAGIGERPYVFDRKRGFETLTPGHDAVVRDDASIYTCGITPYDATHLGHAATYLTTDTLVRVWRDAGFTVRTAMNSTDVDDPLLERATRDGVDWRALAHDQQELFRRDMAALRILPPDHWVAVTEHIDQIADAVAAMLTSGAAYRVRTTDSIADGPDGDDIYFDSTIDRGWPLGLASHTDRATMLQFAAERGGDPDRPGKRDPLDPLLWRAARSGEPSWSSPLGAGRPGWHIECTVIAMDTIGAPFDVALGGCDLRFPHQEFQGQHALALGASMFSDVRMNTGMVKYQGTKMSKSLGNLVRVSELIEEGARPAAIRLALLRHHWGSDWEWTSADLDEAEASLDRWVSWSKAPNLDPSHVDSLAPWLRTTLAANLDTPAALQAVDAFIARAPADDESLDAIDALLGIDLRSIEPR